MNIRQLRYISAVAKHGLNVSATAESLYTSQPGVSKQIRQLEDELGVQIFERSGRQLTRISPAGEAIIELADRALIEIDTIRSAAREFNDPGQGELTIATSHTQAKYRLPPVVHAMRERFPRVDVHLHQGAPLQIAQLLTSGAADFAIATESMEHFEDLVMLPCYQWQRSLVVPAGHPLTEIEQITIKDLATFPLITYVFGFSPNSPLETAFTQAGEKPHLALTATDADVIKTYVRAGLGVGIIASMARDERHDDDLVFLDASHLFAPSTTRLGFRRGSYLREFMYDFVELFAPHLNRDVLDTARAIRSASALDALFVDVELPQY
ncbi:MAG: LysR family cys regulon transcriptional activator [Gammaproteobacteria bacterium]|jgi:LysR family cys regulon transcriptional activator